MFPWLLLLSLPFVAVDQKNANSRGPKYDLTMWADLTREEFKSYQNYGKVGGSREHSSFFCQGEWAGRCLFVGTRLAVFFCKMHHFIISGVRFTFPVSSPLPRPRSIISRPPPL